MTKLYALTCADDPYYPHHEAFYGVFSMPVAAMAFAADNRDPLLPALVWEEFVQPAADPKGRITWTAKDPGSDQYPACEWGVFPTVVNDPKAD